jgi:hypothetical protein
MSKRAMLCLLLLSGGVARADEIKLQTPCRLVDTRNTSVGYLAANTQLDVHVRLPIATSQGGDANCGVAEIASGAILNITAVAPSGTGHVKMWAYGTTEPATSVLNVTGAETSNDGLIVKLGGGNAENVSLKGSVSAYYVIDVVGMVDPRPQYLVGTALSVPTGGVLQVETAEGWIVDAVAPAYLMPQFYDDSVDAVNNGSCVRLDGVWDGARQFLPRSPIQAMPGPCSPDSMAALEDTNRWDAAGRATRVDIYEGALGYEKAHVFVYTTAGVTQTMRTQCGPTLSPFCGDPSNFLPCTRQETTLADPSNPARTIHRFTCASGEGACLHMAGYIFQSTEFGGLPIFVSEPTAHAGCQAS